MFKSLKTLVRAERYLILLGPDSKHGFNVAHAEGLDPTLEPPHMEVITQVLDTRQPFLSERESDLDFECNTRVLTGIRSVLCVPILSKDSKVLGLVYADDRIRAQAFQFTDLLNVQNLIKRMHSKAAEGPAKAPLPTAPKPAPESKSKAALSQADQVLFVLQLATFMKAGVSLIAGLEAMAQDSLANPARRIQRALLQGTSLAQSMAEQARFDPWVISLLRCAERTGQLALTLEMLARGLEKQRQRQMALQASLAYPIFLLLASLVAVMLGPSLVLKSQLEFLRAQNMQLPWLSQALLRWGQLLSNPLGWLLLLALVWGASRWIKSRWARIRPVLQRVAADLPYLGGLVRLYWEIRLLQGLYMLLTPGVDLLESVRLALEGTGSSLWLEQEATLIEQLKSGEPLSLVLTATGLTHRSTRALMVAGEESGRLPVTLEWLARMHQLNFDQALETTSKLLEPLLLMLMGIVVGLVTLASLLPSIRYIQEL